MAVLTRSGRLLMAIGLVQQPLHFGWGTGSPAWDTALVPEDITSTGLLAEVGRRIVDDKGFVLPDPAGEIVIPQGRFRRVQTPTNFVYVRAAFDFADAAASKIREVAVFGGTTTRPDLPPGQRYFAPADLVDPGTLLSIEHIVTINRSGSVRQVFEFVQEI
jgi:hypothetical protein